MSSIVCTWVPGTTDTIRLTTAKTTLKIKLREVHTLLGRQALNDLYLRGRHTKTVSQEELEKLIKG